MNKDNLIWIDLEMTGLEPETNYILEIATAVTDCHLNGLVEGPVFAIHQPDDILEKMDDWNQQTHGESGLLARVKASTLTVEQAQSLTLDFVRQHVPEGVSPMCGNSICLDKQFLRRFMPNLLRHFHYRLLDVSTVKELARRLAPDVYQDIKKESKHLALDDIKDSIEELRHYYQNFLIIPNDTAS